MREILFRGKRIDNGEWVVGSLIDYKPHYQCKHIIYFAKHDDGFLTRFEAEVDSSTVGQYTGLTDKNGKKIFEGDIVRYNTFNDFDCYSVVKIGKYKQDGSGGEYSSRDCLGVYVEVDNFTCPDWAENDPLCFSKYLEHQNLMEVNATCEVIGNIRDNPELLKGAD